MQTASPSVIPKIFNNVLSMGFIFSLFIKKATNGSVARFLKILNLFQAFTADVLKKAVSVLTLSIAAEASIP